MLVWPLEHSSGNRESEGRSGEDHNRDKPGRCAGCKRRARIGRGLGPSRQCHHGARRKQRTGTPWRLPHPVRLSRPEGRNCGYIVRRSAPDCGEFRLLEGIAKIRESYRYILLDCPPALDLLTLNALVAADAVVVPIQCEFFALEGISELMDTIDRVRASFDRPLDIAGILLTMFDDRTNLTRQVAADLREFFGNQVFQTVIPRSIRLAEAPSFGKPILTYDPRSRGAEAYIQLAKEILDHEQDRTRAQGAR